MNFQFSPVRMTGKEKGLQRLFEILPGATSWVILLGMVGLSFWAPIAAAVIIIAFDLYWILRLFYMTFFLVISYLRLSAEQKTNWMGLARQVDTAFEGKMPHREKINGFHWVRKLIAASRAREFRELIVGGSAPPRSSDIIQLVIITVVKEVKQIVEPGIISLTRGEFPASRIVVAIALEERADRKVCAGVKELQECYRRHFFDFLVVTHPSGLPGEARVKGANATYAAKRMSGYFEERKIPSEHVVVSCFDADTIVDPGYFACLTYQYLVCPYRNRASFQPIPVYHNNIWRAPGFARVLEMASSFFQLVEATNPEKLVTFSSHSMSFKALVDVDYWPVDMISDDSAIFWKAYIHYDGEYRVVPLSVTLSMDVVDAGSLWKNVVNVYRQKRRWAWGVENFPIVMRAFLKPGRIPLYDKLRHGFKLFESHVAWATWTFLLSAVGWLPALFSSREFSHSVIYYSAPRITQIIFALSTVALLITIIMSFLLLPKGEVKNPLWRKIEHAFEWLLVPVFAILFSAIPALDAQTRLMFGRYMQFWVTEKKRR